MFGMDEKEALAKLVTIAGAAGLMEMFRGGPPEYNDDDEDEEDRQH